MNEQIQNRKMMKMIRIKECGDCPYCHRINDVRLFCAESNRTFKISGKIPDWCELEEYDE